MALIRSQFDEKEDEYLGTFLVWPVEQSELTLEQEQWQIYVRWNEDYEAGKVGSESHPGHPGMNKRWSELDALLKATRQAVPPIAKRAKAELVFSEEDRRYKLSGPSYRLSWSLL